MGNSVGQGDVRSVKELLTQRARFGDDLAGDLIRHDELDGADRGEFSNALFDRELNRRPASAQVIGEQIGEHDDKHMSTGAVGFRDEDPWHFKKRGFHGAKGEFDLRQPFIACMYGLCRNQPIGQIGLDGIATI